MDNIKFKINENSAWERYAFETNVGGGCICSVRSVEDSTDDPMIKGGVNISATGTVSPEKARQIIKMIQMAIDIYEGKISVDVNPFGKKLSK